MAIFDSPVRYAKTGSLHLAYRIFGDGPSDIVLFPGTLSHAEMTWEMSSNLHLVERLMSFARVIVFDKRGQGLSDRNVAAEQSVEERIGDLRNVIDAVSSRRATVYGWSEGAPASLMFAATYPERIEALVLFGTFASIEDSPWSLPRDDWGQMLKNWEDRWGEGIVLERNAPSAWGRNLFAVPLADGSALRPVPDRLSPSVGCGRAPTFSFCNPKPRFGTGRVVARAVIITNEDCVLRSGRDSGRTRLD